jgi:hypothetical protein
LEDKQSVDRQDKHISFVFPYLTWVDGRICRAEDPFYVVRKRRPGRLIQKNICKGTISQDFLLKVFFINHLPQASENNIRVILNLLENSQRYLQVKVYHAPLSTTPAVNFSTGTAGLVDTGGKFAASINKTCGKLPPISMNHQ